ncbi:SDR family oxidoreductase [Thermogemmatispora onikobensis]|uniref:SDR family oxidoreductase n=1 Tax=Thermogemmatispora onikobensis TaxID=732234 RepID=UPI00085304C5|nr:SDR family oxidoreductase [Thermogemmatispora onikobensis]
MADAPFREHVVLITGASRGIGEQLAYQLAEQGAWLALAARSSEALETVAATCRTRGARALAVPTDLRDEAQCRRLVERTISEYGRLDMLINNAGMGFPRRFETLSDLSTIRAEIELNYLGTVYCTYYALPYLKRSRGRIVGVNSFGGQLGLPGTAGYNASKHAMRGFLNTLRTELHGSGVSVSITYLSAVRTARLQEVMGKQARKVPALDPDRCARLILRQAARRRREQVLTLSGKTLVWLNRWAPALVERLLASTALISYRE